MKIVVIGCGTIGKTIIEHVAKEKHNLVIIDTDSDTVEDLVERFDVFGVVGNGASLDIQEEAKTGNADLVVAVSPDDELNIMSCMLAKKLGAASTIARVRKPEYKRQTELMKEELGLSMVVNPEQETADEIMQMINIPSVLKLEKFAKGKVNLVEIVLEEGNPLIGETLISMNKKIKTKVLICAVERKDQVYIPTGNFKMEKGDHLSIASDANSLASFLTELNLIKSPLKRIMIVGGSKIGYYLAKELLSKKYKVDLIEYDKTRAAELAVLLPKANVICGDGTDPEVLKEEGIDVVDAFVALTNVDEENIIVSMYALKQKVRKVITKNKRSNFLNMLDELGIENIVSPKEIVASRIVSYIRALNNSKGSNVITLYKLVDNKVEALEFIAKKKSRIIGKPLKDLSIKQNCLIACIIRDGVVIIPNGNDTIELNDNVIVVTTHEQFDDLKDAFE